MPSSYVTIKVTGAGSLLVATPKRRGGSAARYDEDLYSWAKEQAALLRAGCTDSADLQNIAEELDDVGNEQYDKLESVLRVLLIHMLKWDRQPERRSRSWALTIRIQRNHAAKVLRKNPGLKPHRAEAVADAYETARIEAADETGLSLDIFPEVCPYAWDEIIERPFDWLPSRT
jgi:Domain of unknown function DUF29